MKNILLLLFTVNCFAQIPIEWQKSYTGAGNDGGLKVIQTNDSGFAIAGRSETTGHGGTDLLIIKTDAQGNWQWRKFYGGSNDDCAYSIIQTSDNGYIVAGYTFSSNGNVTSNHGAQDYWILK